MVKEGLFLLAIKRLEIISQLLSENGSVDATKLSERFAVTPKTIRKDLDKLENMGLLDRVHGGAVLKRSGSNVFPIEQRKKQQNLRKNSASVPRRWNIFRKETASSSTVEQRPLNWRGYWVKRKFWRSSVI